MTNYDFFSYLTLLIPGYHFKGMLGFFQGCRFLFPISSQWHFEARHSDGPSLSRDPPWPTRLWNQRNGAPLECEHDVPVYRYGLHIPESLVVSLPTPYVSEGTSHQKDSETRRGDDFVRSADATRFSDILGHRSVLPPNLVWFF
jgi:hypothetical protein